MSDSTASSTSQESFDLPKTAAASPVPLVVGNMVPVNKKRKLEEADIGESFSLDDIEIEKMYETVEINGKQVKKLVNCSASTILGCVAETVSCKVIRKVLVKIGVKGYRNKTKKEWLDLIGHMKHNSSVYEQLYNAEESINGGGEAETSTRKKSGCAFRLMNVVFSASFITRLAKLASKRTREQLDGRQSVESKFWNDVREAFIDDADDEIGKLQFQHAVFQEHDLDAFEIVPHSASKLSAMFRDLKSRHKTALAKFTKSGTHGSDFWDFCSGQIDILYYHFFVRANPGIEEAVTAMMPASVRMDSDKIEEVGVESSPKTPSNSTASGRASREDDKARRFLAMLDSSSMQTEVAKHRIEDFKSVREYRLKKTHREEERHQRYREKIEREERVFYLKQHSQLLADIRRLTKEKAEESDPALKELIIDDIEIMKKEVNRVKQYLFSGEK